VASTQVYLELGKKRVFAGGLDWPGWCRSGRDEEAALEALVSSGPRYAKAVGPAGRGFKPPTKAWSLKVVERLEGNATTDFGAPGLPPAADDRPLTDAEARRQIALLEAAWRALDRAAEAAVGVELRKGPRGGGRDLDAIVRHVADADTGYLAQIGDRFTLREGDPLTRAIVEDLHGTIVEALWARIRGDPPRKPRRTGKYWTPRYFIRRSAWHALDHTWEIEDRAGPA